jgi:surface protein
MTNSKLPYGSIAGTERAFPGTSNCAPERTPKTLPLRLDTPSTNRMYPTFKTFQTSSMMFTRLRSMFCDRNTSNQDLSSWDVSKVTDMAWMFCHAGNFNQDLLSGNTGAVSDMTEMFFDATSFNQVISSWDTSSVNGHNVL